MRSLLYFKLNNRDETLRRLLELSNQELMGDPSIDTTLYGVIKDIYGNQLFWGLGWGNARRRWMFVEWNPTRKPAPEIIKSIFNILDHPDINGILDTDGMEDDNPLIII
jgi:hypothetical protein